MSNPQVIDIPNIKIEYDLDGGPDQQVLLEQDWVGNVDRVSLHPSQVRLIAERMGVLPPSDIESQRTIARLCRQMRLLQERIQRLDKFLCITASAGHENLDEELAFSGATLDLVNEFILELPDANPPKSGGVDAGNPPKSGGVEGGNDPKTGGVSGQLDLVEKSR